uniref:RNA helicase n=1 Tax=Strongyloides stercoralis TaxID=6248 RepID=A0A0K0DVZ8_STRER
MFNVFSLTNIVKLRKLRLKQLDFTISRSATTTPLILKKNSNIRKKKYINKGVFYSQNNAGKPLEDLIKPLQVELAPKKYQPTYVDGLEDLNDSQISSILDDFIRRPIIRDMAVQNGLSDKIFMATFKSFRKMCIHDKNLDIETKLFLSDIHNKKASLDILFKPFLDHARQIYPHLESMEDLKISSDLTQPHNWYPLARKVLRKVFLHVGPTNSGKTHAALERFKSAKSAVYGAPLRLLAQEIYTKSHSFGLKCDLLTGEDRRYAINPQTPSSHCSCTVEMLDVTHPIEVAIIDEIQLLRDEQRGHAFSRALLGVPAEEIHLCGEVASIDIVKKILDPIGEHVEIREYQRKSSLKICDYALQDISNVKKGDALICFSKRDVYKFGRILKEKKIPFSVIYGQLPPGTKLEQARKFNDPNDPTKVLIATDAIGMGLNLNIGRIIFTSLTKMHSTLIPTYVALQIAGRAGRFGTEFDEGKVMPLDNKDINLLKAILEKPVEPIDKAGIAPNYEQIETFSYHLPNATLVNILDIFKSICSINDTFFLCNFDQVRDLAVLINSINMPMNIKYTFCLAPIKPDNTFLSMSFLKIARRFSTDQTISYQWFCDLIKYPFKQIKTENDLITFGNVYELIVFYLWMSYHYQDMFPDYLEVKELEKEADEHIKKCLENFGM